MTAQLHELFQSFWTIYPRRVAKLDAMKAFDKALKIAPAADIIAGARRYAAIQREPQFTAFPATWLRAGRWMDEAEAPPALQRQTMAGLFTDMESYFGSDGQAGSDQAAQGTLLSLPFDGSKH